MKEGYLRVTDILKQAGIIGRGVEFASDHAIWRGQTVHQAVQYLIKGTLDWDTVDEGITGYVAAFQDYRIRNIYEVILTEERLYDDTLRITGRIDLLCLMEDGRYAIIDLKTGPIQKSTAIQMGAYLYLLESQGDVFKERHKDLMNLHPRRIALRLNQDGSWQAEAFTDYKDIQVFMSAYSIVNWRQNNKVK